MPCESKAASVLQDEFQAVLPTSQLHKSGEASKADTIVTLALIIPIASYLQPQVDHPLPRSIMLVSSGLCWTTSLPSPPISLLHRGTGQHPQMHKAPQVRGTVDQTSTLRAPHLNHLLHQRPPLQMTLTDQFKKNLVHGNSLMNSKSMKTGSLHHILRLIPALPKMALVIVGQRCLRGVDQAPGQTNATPRRAHLLPLL